MKILRKKGLHSILITIIVLQFLLLLVATWWGATKIVKHLEEDQRKNISELVSKMMNNKEQWARNQLETLSNSAYIQNSFNNKSELYDYSYPVLNRLSSQGLSQLNYYTTTGNVYLKASDPVDLSIGKRKVPVTSAIEDRVVFGVEEEKGEVYGFIASPFYSEGKKIGIMELGINMEPLLKELRNILNAEIGISLNNSVIYSTGDIVKSVTNSPYLFDGGKKYKVYVSDISGKREISLIVLKDITLLSNILSQSKIFIASMGFVTAIIFSFIIIKVLHPLTNIINTLKEMENGDLRKEVEVSTIKDLALGINNFIYNLRGIIKNIQNVSESVVSATKRISTSSDVLSKGANKQAESTEITSASINQLNSSIKEIAYDTEYLADLANKNMRSILNMTSSIDQIAKSTDMLSSLIEISSFSIDHMSASIIEIVENVSSISNVADNTTKAVDDITMNIKEIETTVDKSVAISEDVKKEASNLGVRAVEKTMDGMNRIMRSVDNTGKVITGLKKRSREIERILTIINDVTDQTTLLALNASIIAAKAGDHGRGFTVVANEIKGVAKKTASSTKEIAQMITTIQGEIDEAVSSVEEVTKITVEGISVSREAKDVLTKILEKADKSVKKILEIKEATKGQEKGAGQVKELVQTTNYMLKEILSSTQDQKKDSEQIIEAFTQMKGASREVHQALSNQTIESKEINSIVENVNSKIQSIALVAKEEQLGTEQIVIAIQKINYITQQNLSLSFAVNEAVNILVKQTSILKEDVDKFVI